MSNWGYYINVDNQIDFDSSSKELLHKLIALEPTIGLCFACGSCAGTCSAGNYTQFSLRKIIIHVSRGETQALSHEISKCMLCGKCTLICPRGVNTRNIVLSIKKVLDEFAVTNV